MIGDEGGGEVVEEEVVEATRLGEILKRGLDVESLLLRVRACILFSFVILCFSGLIAGAGGCN